MAQHQAKKQTRKYRFLKQQLTKNHNISMEQTQTHTKVVLFNKPFGVHSQFRKEHENMPTLLDFFDDKTLRIAGRLDANSEGLLLLTDNGKLVHTITTPPKHKYNKKQAKCYLVQVEGIPTGAQLQILSQGVWLKDGKTLPATVQKLDENTLPIALWQRQKPIRVRKHIATSWIVLKIVEGKNRQVRRMCAAVGLPCLRLIRYQIACFALEDLPVGAHKILMFNHKQLQNLGLL